MNKPNEPRNPNTPAQDAEQLQKGGAASAQQPFHKAEQISQKPGVSQAANKDPRPEQKLAQGPAKAAGQEPKKS